MFTTELANEFFLQKLMDLFILFNGFINSKHVFCNLFKTEENTL